MSILFQKLNLFQNKWLNTLFYGLIFLIIANLFLSFNIITTSFATITSVSPSYTIQETSYDVKKENDNLSGPSSIYHPIASEKKDEKENGHLFLEENKKEDNTGVSILKILIEGGMSALMLVLLLRVLPETLKYIRQIQQDAREEIQRNTEANKEMLESLVKEFKYVTDELMKKFEEQDARWFTLISQRGYCPIRDKLVNPPSISDETKKL